MAAGGTVLDCSGRIHLSELTTSISSFVREKEEKLRPRHITDAAVQASMRVHFIDMNVFHEDPSVLMDDLSGFLMSKVGALVGGPFMNLCVNTTI